MKSLVNGLWRSIKWLIFFLLIIPLIPIDFIFDMGHDGSEESPPGYICKWCKK